MTSAKRVASQWVASWGGYNNKSEAPKGAIWLCRLGGLSPIWQTNDAAPVSKGFWAFLWPQIEPFLVGATDDRGNVRLREEEILEKRRPSRYELNKQKKLKLRKFKYTGWLWTRLNDARRYAVEEKNDWFLVDSANLAKIAHHILHELQAGAQKDGYLVGGRLPYPKDMFEVFVPANEGSILGKPFRTGPYEDPNEEFEKQAARPIKLDMSSVEDCLDRIFRKLKQLPEGYVGDLEKSLPIDMINLFDVQGTFKSVWVQLISGEGQGPVTGGSFGFVTAGPEKGSPIINIGLNSRYPLGSLIPIARPMIRSTLLHELTHASDVFPIVELSGKGNLRSESDVDLKVYYNDPSEIKAYMRQIYESVAPFVKNQIAKPRPKERGVSWLVSWALALSTQWKQAKPYLTQANKNRIMKGIITALEDDGIL